MHGVLLDRTGEIHNKLKIIEELGHDEVMCQCIECSYIDKYNKGNVVREQTCCRLCRNNKIGRTFNGLTITEVIDKKHVLAKCEKCGETRQYLTDSVISSRTNCKACLPKLHNNIGEVHRTLEIIGDSGGRVVTTKCTICGDIDTYKKSDVRLRGINCRQCIKNIKLYAGDKDKRDIQSTINYNSIVGETYRGLKVVQELGNGKVLAVCTKCNTEQEHFRYNISHNQSVCTYCGVGDNSAVYRIIGKQFGDVTPLKYEYTGRDKKFYYTCRCVKCEEELLLNYDEIFTYKCNRGL